MQTLPDMLTADQVAKVLGVVTANTVREWARTGRIDARQVTRGGRWMIPRRAVDKLMSDSKEE
jgi:excisionase family DNA binding protein